MPSGGEGRIVLRETREEEKSPGEERWKDVSRLRELGRTATEYLMIDLWDEDKKVRLAAIDALGSLKDTRAYEHLVPLLSDVDHDIRFATAVALGELGDSRAVVPLERACRDPNRYVRAAALESIQKLRV